MRAILISGTPGTGKSTIAKELSLLLDIPLISMTEVAREEGLFEEFDKKRETHLVDTRRLVSLLQAYLKKKGGMALIEGHLAHHFPPRHTGVCLICTTELSLLRDRLKERGYDEEKVRENLDSEIFAVCLTEAIEEGHEPFTLDTTQPVEQSVKEAATIIKEHVPDVSF